MKIKTKLIKMKRLFILVLVLLGGANTLFSQAENAVTSLKRWKAILGMAEGKTFAEAIYNVYYILLCLVIIFGMIWGIVYALNKFLDYVRNYYYYQMMKKLSFLERELDKHPSFLLVRANNSNANTTG